MKRTRIKSMSNKRRAQLKDRKKVRAVVLERDQGCVAARVPGVLEVWGPCWHPAGQELDVHEVLPRGRGGDWLDPENCIALCRQHHQRVTEEPLKAMAFGLSESGYGGPRPLP